MNDVRDKVLEMYIEWVNSMNAGKFGFKDFHDAQWVMTNNQLVTMSYLDDGGWVFVVAYVDRFDIQQMVQFIDGQMTVVKGA